MEIKSVSDEFRHRDGRAYNGGCIGLRSVPITWASGYSEAGVCDKKFSFCLVEAYICIGQATYQTQSPKYQFQLQGQEHAEDA